MYNQDSVMRTVKTMTASSLYLAGVIGYSVYGLFDLLGDILGGSGLSGILNRLLAMNWGYGAEYFYLQSYMSFVRGVSVMAALIGAIPVILIAVGLWMLFASAKNNSKPDVDRMGFTIIRIIVIIRLVCTCLGVALAEFLCIVAMIGANEIIGYYNAGYSAGGFAVFIMIGIAAVSAPAIVYYVKLGKTINIMRNVITSGRPDSGISRYVEIFCYILGGISAVSALMSLAGMSVYGFLAQAGLAAAYIIFAIFQMKYRRNMEALCENQGMGMNVREMQGQSVNLAYQQPVQQPYQQTEQQSHQQAVEPCGKKNETTVLPYYNETSVLSGQILTGGKTQLVRMTRQKTGETICISKPSFWIGKDNAYVDYCIADNTAISRRHALVTIQNSNCYLRDNHSTNRVFVNGQALQPDTDMPLSNGDRVRLGDEEFIVSIG